jgi:EAL domain-containing protein (putative c-di-GMP-specific phosphodiesterase class I)
MTRLLSELSGEMLTSRELADTRALFKSGDEEPTADDIPEVRSLKQLATLDRSGWLLDLLSEGRLTSVFQPIVRVEDTSEVFAQECLLRGVDRGGGFIPPQPILDAARDCGMLFQADLAARHTAIHEAADHGIGDNLFVNFSPTSIYDPVFCLRSTVEAVNETGLSPKNVVFEVTETEEVGDPEHLRSIVSYYRNQGFRIALDDLGSGYSSLNLIHRLRPDFVKLDLHLIRDVDTDPYKAVIARKLLELARSLGVQTIVEGVETPGEMRWIWAEGADFVQGYLIARPSSPPVESLGAL